MKEAVSAKALEEWIKEFFDIENADVHSVSINPEGVTVVVLPKDADGKRIYVGPKFAPHPKQTTHHVALLKPGRPEGTTVANGAKPKTKKASAPEPVIMRGGSAE